MDHLINLYQEETVLNLHKGKYDLYFLGGFEILNEADFIIGVFNFDFTEQIKFQFANRIRTRINGQRGVKYFSFEITKTANYLLLIQNPDGLTIKKSMLWTWNLFQSEVRKGDKNVFIERVYDR